MAKKLTRIIEPRILVALVVMVFAHVFFITQSVQAAELKFIPNVPIGSWGKTPIIFKSCDAGAQNCGYDQLAQYITVIYRYGLAAAGSLAVLMIMIGGFLWLTSAGASDRVSSGKEYIAAAISGLVLAMFSFTLLYIINPQLVRLQSITVTPIIPLSAHDQSYRAQTNPAGGRSTVPSVRGQDLHAGDGFRSKLTGYTPENTRMEGGPRDRVGNYLRTLDDYIAGKVSFVSVAMDSQNGIPYGTVLNIPGLENALRNSGQTFTSPIPFVVVDTGQAFIGQGTGAMDICTENQSSANNQLVNVEYSIIDTGQVITVDRGTHPLQN